MTKKLALLSILLLAFFLRVFNLTTVPPGWRDDEVLETTVHAQIVLDGHYPLYFIQAEGHEPIYHYMTAGWIALVGRTLFSVRLVSVFFGLLTVAAAFRFTRQLFGMRTALLVALLIAVSFWALMYSRTKIRHIAELPFALLAFSHLFKFISHPSSVASRRRPWVTRNEHWSLIHCSLFIALALYAYLAATTLFIIFAAFGFYLLITNNVFHLTPHVPRATRYVFFILALSLLLYLPLANAIRANATRLAVVGGPLTELRNGNFQPLLNNTLSTLAMFGNTGDNEALYNIPGRPVFNVVGFYFFLGGLFIALTRWRDPRYAFLLIWLMGGLTPGFASNPPASLGHTLTALPVVYTLAVLPMTHLRISHFVPRFLFSALLLGSIALHDLPDYFMSWPALPAVRYLYKADLHTAANQLRGAPPATYVLSGPLSKWDRAAFTLEGLGLESPPRWVNAEWANVFPTQPAHYLFSPASWQIDQPPEHSLSIHFANDLIFDGWTQQGNSLLAHWRVGAAYAVSEPDLGPSVASPPFPVTAFMHLLDANGNFVAGSDRFDVDAFTLQPSDRYLQRHTFDAPSGSYLMEIGLYNPTTGERMLTDTGGDTVHLGTLIVP